MIPSPNAHERGFTVPELIVAMTLTAFFSALIMTFAFMYWRGAANLQVDLDTFGSRVDADDALRSRIGISSGLIIQNSIADAHTNNPDPAISSNLYWKPLHAIPGNYPVGASGA